MNNKNIRNSTEAMAVRQIYPELPPQRNSVAIAPDTLAVSVPTVKERRTAPCGDAKVHYTLERSATQPSKKVAILIPGFLGIEPSYGPQRHAMVLSGQDTVSIRPHGGPSSFNSLVHSDVASAKAVWAVMRDLLAHQDAEVFTLHGHSMGGRDGSEAASHIATHKDPSLIESVHLYGPAGTTTDNPLQIFEGFMSMMEHEVMPNLGRLAANMRPECSPLGVIGHFAAYVRGFLKTAAEGISTATSADIKADIGILQSRGIPVTATYGVTDRVFRPERAEAYIGQDVAAFRVLETPYNIGHVGPQLHPQLIADQQLGLVNSYARKVS